MWQTRPHTYARILAAIQAEPWLVEESALHDIVAVLERRQAGERLDEGEIAAKLEAKGRPRESAEAPRAIAVINVFGLLVQRAANLNISERGTSVERLSALYKAAQDDPKIGAIVLNFDTPGGSVHGIPEFADVIANYGGERRKRVEAVVNSLCASGGYYLAAQCHRISAVIDGEVGSVGATAVHVDESKRIADEGFTVTISRYPKDGHKAEFTSMEPLSPEAAEHLNNQVAAVGLLFEKAVARGRGVSLKRVQETFGQGRVFGATEALKLGMIDRIDTLQGTIDRLAGRLGRGASVITPPTLEQPDDIAAESRRTDQRLAEEKAMPDNPITEEGLRALLKESAEGVRASLNADVEKLLAPIKEQAETAAKQAADTAAAMQAVQAASAEANATATRTAWDTQLGELERATKITPAERPVYLTALLAITEEKDRTAFLATLQAREPKLAGNAVTALVIEENGQQVDLVGEFGDDVAGLHAGGANAFAEGVRTFPGGLEASRREPVKFAAHMDRITRGRPHWAVN